MRYQILIVLLIVFTLHVPAFSTSIIYTYDEMDRLTDATTPNCFKIEYTYDKIGNLLTKKATFIPISAAYICADTLYTLNASTGHCERPPVCSQGTYDTTYGKCTQAYPCPSGYNWVANRNRCEKAPVCTSGTYNSITDKCESGITYTASNNCSSFGQSFGQSFVFNNINGRCEYNLLDNQWCGGIQDYQYIGNGNCYDPYTHTTFMDSCPGQTNVLNSNLDAARNVCYVAAPYSCNNGGTLNGSTCTITSYTATPNYSCPSGGTLSGAQCTINSSYPASISSYSCPSGSTLSGSTCTTTSTYAAANNCNSYPASFWQTFVFNSSNGRCEYNLVGTQWCDGIQDDEYIGGGNCYDPYEQTTFMIDCPSQTGVSSSLDAAHNVCYVAAHLSCNAGGTLIGNSCAGISAALPNYSCPSGGTLSGTQCIISSSYAATPAYTCPSGGTLSGTTCSTLTQINPTCTGGTLDSVMDFCWTNSTSGCPVGMTYNSTTGLCELSATCANSLLDFTNNVCYQPVTASCPAGYALLGGKCVCQ